MRRAIAFIVGPPLLALALGACATSNNKDTKTVPAAMKAAKEVKVSKHGDERRVRPARVARLLRTVPHVAVRIESRVALKGFVGSVRARATGYGVTEEVGVFTASRANSLTRRTVRRATKAVPGAIAQDVDVEGNAAVVVSSKGHRQSDGRFTRGANHLAVAIDERIASGSGLPFAP